MDTKILVRVGERGYPPAPPEKDEFCVEKVVCGGGGGYSLFAEYLGWLGSPVVCKDLVNGGRSVVGLRSRMSRKSNVFQDFRNFRKNCAKIEFRPGHKNCAKFRSGGPQNCAQIRPGHKNCATCRPDVSKIVLKLC